MSLSQDTLPCTVTILRQKVRNLPVGEIAVLEVFDPGSERPVRTQHIQFLVLENPAEHEYLGLIVGSQSPDSYQGEIDKLIQSLLKAGRLIRSDVDMKNAQLNIFSAEPFS